MSEQVSSSSLAYRLFVDTCRSPATRKHYAKALGYFMDYLRLERGAYDKLLPPERDTKVIQIDIRDNSPSQKRKGINFCVLIHCSYEQVLRYERCDAKLETEAETT